MKLAYKDRIALSFMFATAVVIALVFLLVYFTVKETVYSNLDKDLAFEAVKHTGEIVIESNKIRFVNKAEWEEIEHREVQVNPVFIQLIDTEGVLMDRSPNLKGAQLMFSADQKTNAHFNTQLSDRNIRQVQVPLTAHKEVKGYILVAMSLDASLMVINKLRSILLISYPLVLIGLFFISRIFAGRSILPIKHIVSTTNKITRQNLDERVQLPKSQDELYDLSSAINGLMDRIQSAINRERQFTSDASHELRTPLSALRGTLEILIRKPRNHEEYVEKINYGLREIDHMTNTVEKLLILARFDKEPLAANEQEAHIITMIDDIIQRHKKEIVERNIKIKVTNDSTGDQLVSTYYGGLILENIINNAVKYSPPQSTVSISIDDAEDGQRRCTVTDQGEGIAEENLNQIFRPFFRSNMLHNKSTSGSGLGLSIAQKSAEAIGAKIQVDSMLGKGTTFTITF